MRLFSGKIPAIATDIVRRLTDNDQILVGNRQEAELDIQAILKEYLRLERELTEKAKDIVAQKQLPYEQYGKIKRSLASDIRFGLGEDGLDWMTRQMIEAFMQSAHVDEVFVEDNILRREMTKILKHHMMVDKDLDVEVRRHIKNLEEGTGGWDVEYQKAMAKIKRNRGLEG